eukprot:GILI01009256.1.p1 GENE.GILI01009256.1~~GILI01009256.1.p1  ORF type:complete len:443 (+),score=66.46 GILI01009256.1:12-1340(+)
MFTKKVGYHTPQEPTQAEPNPPDAPPADPKPADATPADAKPADATPGDAKPADAKADATQPKPTVSSQSSFGTSESFTGGNSAPTSDFGLSKTSEVATREGGFTSLTFPVGPKPAGFNSAPASGVLAGNKPASQTAFGFAGGNNSAPTSGFGNTLDKPFKPAIHSAATVSDSTAVPGLKQVSGFGVKSSSQMGAVNAITVTTTKQPEAGVAKEPIQRSSSESTTPRSPSNSTESSQFVNDNQIYSPPPSSRAGLQSTDNSPLPSSRSQKPTHVATSSPNPSGVTLTPTSLDAAPTSTFVSQKLNATQTPSQPSSFGFGQKTSQPAVTTTSTFGSAQPSPVKSDTTAMIPLEFVRQLKTMEDFEDEDRKTLLMTELKLSEALTSLRSDIRDGYKPKAADLAQLGLDESIFARKDIGFYPADRQTRLQALLERAWNPTLLPRYQ